MDSTSWDPTTAQVGHSYHIFNPSEYGPMTATATMTTNQEQFAHFSFVLLTDICMAFRGVYTWGQDIDTGDLYSRWEGPLSERAACT